MSGGIVVKLKFKTSNPAKAYALLFFRIADGPYREFPIMKVTVNVIKHRPTWAYNRAEGIITLKSLYRMHNYKGEIPFTVTWDEIQESLKEIEEIPREQGNYFKIGTQANGWKF